MDIRRRTRLVQMKTYSIIDVISSEIILSFQMSFSNMRIIPISTLHETPISQHHSNLEVGLNFVHDSSLWELLTSRIFEADLIKYGVVHGYSHSQNVYPSIQPHWNLSSVFYWCLTCRLSILSSVPLWNM